MFGTPGRVKNCINAKDEDESKDRTYLPQAVDAIFLSPPWDVVDYGKVGGHRYDLTCIKIDADDGIQGDGEWRLEQAIKEVENKGIAYSLLNGLQLAKSAHRAGCKGPMFWSRTSRRYLDLAWKTRKWKSACASDKRLRFLVHQEPCPTTNSKSS